MLTVDEVIELVVTCSDDMVDRVRIATHMQVLVDEIEGLRDRLEAAEDVLEAAEDVLEAARLDHVAI